MRINLLSVCRTFVKESLNATNSLWDRCFLCFYVILWTANPNPPSQAAVDGFRHSCGCHRQAWPLFQDDQTQRLWLWFYDNSCRIFISSILLLLFCLNWHIFSRCLFIPQFKTSPYPWVWISWILQRIGWIREYHCIPIIRPEPILVIYLCALMWLRYKVSFIPRGCLWVRLRYSFFRSNNPLTEVEKKKGVLPQRCGEKQP